MSLGYISAGVGIVSGISNMARGSGSGSSSQSTTNSTRREYLPFETKQSDNAAAITRGQWDYAKQFYTPIENELIADASKINEGEVQRASQLAQRGVNNEYSGMQRDLRRQGVRLSDAQQTVFDRQRQLDLATGKASAMNQDRLAQYERNKNLLSTLAGYGRSNLQQANAAANAAAGMEAQRNIQGGYTDYSDSTSTVEQKSSSGGRI